MEALAIIKLLYRWMQCLLFLNSLACGVGYGGFSDHYTALSSVRSSCCFACSSPSNAIHKLIRKQKRLRSTRANDLPCRHLSETSIQAPPQAKIPTCSESPRNAIYKFVPKQRKSTCSEHGCPTADTHAHSTKTSMPIMTCPVATSAKDQRNTFRAAGWTQLDHYISDLAA